MAVFLDMAQMGAVLKIRYDNRIGSSLQIVVDGQSFLLTANHLVSGAARGDKLAIHKKTEWILFEILGIAADAVGHDIAAIKVNLPPAYGIKEEKLGAPLTVGADIAFLGFPLRLKMLDSDFDYGFPTPFLKSGVFSGANKVGERTEFLFDALNNKGFSGGPIFVNAKDGKPRVVSIVSGYKYDDPLALQRVTNIGTTEPVPEYAILPNSGFMIGSHISLGLKAARTLI